MRKDFILVVIGILALVLGMALNVNAMGSKGWLSDPCFDKDGNRISNFGHCNDNKGGTKFVPMYENEEGEGNDGGSDTAGDSSSGPGGSGGSKGGDDEGSRGDNGIGNGDNDGTNPGTDNCNSGDYS